jgi:hypothetical protein
MAGKKKNNYTVLRGNELKPLPRLSLLLFVEMLLKPRLLAIGISSLGARIAERCIAVLPLTGQTSLSFSRR